MRFQSYNLLVDSRTVGVDRALGKNSVFVGGYLIVGKHRFELFFKTHAVGFDIILGQRLDFSNA